MELQTRIPMASETPKIDYDSKIVLLGSCFSENIGKKLAYFKFQNYTNPFGIIFHPIALERLVHRALTKEYFTKDDIFEQQGRWHCLQVHSLLWGNDEKSYLQRLNSILDETARWIETSSHIVITFGTAWGYRHIEKDSIVANCHKLPHTDFIKEISDIVQLIAVNERLAKTISEVNGKAKLIFTVSPVRHAKDGLVENSRSKSQLLVAIHKLIETNSTIAYFPSFEIMMDELRDYRFYADDMLHPNNLAINIIWDRFSSTWVDSSTASTSKEIDTIQTALKHKPLRPESSEHKLFIENLQRRIKAIQQQFPDIKF